MGVPAPRAYLLSPNKAFASKYAVAIEYLDGLRRIDKDHIPENLRADLLAQYALYLVLRLDDIIQIRCTDEHIYSFDFSEGFNNIEMRYFLHAGEGMIVDFLRMRFQQFKRAVESETFDHPIIAQEYSIDPEDAKNGMISVVKRAAYITDDDLNDLSEEITTMYPKKVADYYTECIRVIREKAKSLS